MDIQLQPQRIVVSSMQREIDAMHEQNALMQQKLIALTLLMQQTEQARDNANTAATNATNHLSRTDNPHNVTKAQVGLANVNNTSDADKPISTATQAVLNGKANTNHTHTKSNITDFQHTHLVSDIIGLGSDGSGGGLPQIYLDQQTINIPAQGGSFTLSIHNLKWTASCPGWATGTPSSGMGILFNGQDNTMTIAVASNYIEDTTTNPRTGYIIIDNALGQRLTCQINQAGHYVYEPGPDYSISPTHYPNIIPPQGATFTQQLTCNAQVIVSNTTNNVLGTEDPNVINPEIEWFTATINSNNLLTVVVRDIWFGKVYDGNTINPALPNPPPASARFGTIKLATTETPLDLADFIFGQNGNGDTISPDFIW